MFNSFWMMPDDGRGYKRLGKSNSVLLQQVNTVSSLVFANMFTCIKLAVS